MELYIIFILLILLLIVYVKNKKEHFSTPEEALESISSLYNNKNMTVSNLNITNNLNPANFKGIIVAYSGDISGIPVGWILCDGTNGTPDLRGRFIYGYNPNDTQIKTNTGEIIRNKLNLKDVSGSEYHTLTINEMPSHNHSINVGSGSGYTNGDRVDMYSNNSGLMQLTNMIGSSGGNKPHNNMPPYIVLAYIMKI